ncbi:MAG: hypothetical protein KIY12_00315 [Thermoplasmata archaeon]|uniref:Uncharacterized protein n=1 Tax=Candidatus Sysuiplasma superficiale TaxID=2823368 RepID=A0A8J7YIE8_9ARCH|nr:hypothetical protein [Candidatus Sysuiplasma superficiale]MBX8643167.1 hypothetical protein [Candidatus Sysuiplasma superficiale]
MPEIMLNSYRIRDIADAVLGRNWEEELQQYLTMLERKGVIIREIVEAEERERTDYESFISLFFPARRYRREILSSNKPEVLDDAISSLRNCAETPALTELKFAQMSGAPAAVLRDMAYEGMHFMFPERYCLATRWVWNPERGTGALRDVIRAEKRDMSFEERQKVLRNILSSIKVHGYVFRDSFPLDLMCALYYSQEVIGAKDHSMNAGGMEALFPSHGAVSVMILGLRGLKYANP